MNFSIQTWENEMNLLKYKNGEMVFIMINNEIRSGIIAGESDPDTYEIKMDDESIVRINGISVYSTPHSLTDDLIQNYHRKLIV